MNLLNFSEAELVMEYRDIEYQLVQTADPCCWKWTIFLDATRTRTGISLTRADAVLDAERAIDAFLEKRKPSSVARQK